MASFDEEELRIPDKIKREVLVDSDEYEDEELRLVLEMSQNEYFENISYDLNNNNDAKDEKDAKEEIGITVANDANEEIRIEKAEITISNEQIEVSINDIEKQIENPISEEISESVTIDIPEKYSSEEEKLERKKNLSNFLRRIEMLRFLSEEEIDTRALILDILHKYFEGVIDYILLDTPIYFNVTKMINQFYYIPNKLNKLPGIPLEEDTLIRHIFLCR